MYVVHEYLSHHVWAAAIAGMWAFAILLELRPTFV